MKKKSFEKIVFISLCFSVSVLFSACQMFTTSWGTKLQRNQQEFLKKASASDLLAFTQGANASKSETVKAVLNLLSQKDPEELKKLPVADKETALKLTTDATLPMEKIGEIAAQAGNLASTPDEMGKIVKKLSDNMGTFDTKASAQLLSDPEAMRKADPNVLANAAVSLIAQVAAKNGGYDKIKNNIQTAGGSIDFKNHSADDIVGKMLGASASQEDKAALKAAVNAAKLLSGAGDAKDSAGNTVPKRDIDPEKVKLLGIKPLSDILKAF